MKPVIKMSFGELHHKFVSNYQKLISLLEHSDIYVNIDGFQYRITTEELLVEVVIKYK